MSSINKRLVIAGFCLTLFSCISTPRQSESQFVLQRIAQAKKLKADNDLNAALNQWKIIIVLDPSNFEAKDEIRHLETQINTATNNYFSKGISAYNSKSFRRAELYFLKTLALKPNHKAFEYLQKINTQRMLTAQTNKNLSSQYTKKHQELLNKNKIVTNLQSLFKSKNYSKISEYARGSKISQMDPEILSILYESEFHLTQNFLEKQNMTQAALHFTQMQLHAPKTQEHFLQISDLKNKMANGYYIQAKKFLSSDLVQATKTAEKALEYDPEHSAAQILLRQARHMQDKLSKIKQLN